MIIVIIHTDCNYGAILFEISSNRRPESESESKLFDFFLMPSSDESLPSSSIMRRPSDVVLKPLSFFFFVSTCDCSPGLVAET